MPDDTFTSDEIASADTSTASASSAAQASDDQATHGTARASSDAGGGDGRGPIPYQDHERIVDGFHERLDRLSWAESLDPREVEEARQIADLYRRDPGRLLEHLSRTVPRREAPGPDVRDERGEAFYSPAQAAALVRHEVESAVAQLRGEFAERLSPIEAHDRESQQLASLSDQIERAQGWPGFADHIEAITEAIATANRRRERLTLHDAYIQVVTPKLSASREALTSEIRKQVLAELEQTSEVTRGDVNPRRSPAATHKKDRDKSFKELLGETAAAMSR